MIFMITFKDRYKCINYAGLESLPGIIGTAMLGVSTVEMVLSTAVRMSVLYAWKGPGPWMAAAVWGTAF